MTKLSDVCWQLVYDEYRSHDCNRPAKGHTMDGNPACGIHLAAERKRAATREKDRTDRAAAGLVMDRADALAASLTRRLGVLVTAQTNTPRTPPYLLVPTGLMELRPDDLAALAERLESQS